MKTTKKNSLELPHLARPTGVESVRFHDGMLVTADDLEAATDYPLSLLRTVLRAFFGCGVVCGLELTTRTVSEEPVWTLCVGRGLAVDCEGYPVELVKPVVLDLSPDPCASEPPPTEVFIAARRITSVEDPRTACSCGDDGADVECTRVRDQILVQAFTLDGPDALPWNVCRREPAPGEEQADCTTEEKKVGASPSTTEAWCSAMTGCPSCSCDGDWVLLGSVALDEKDGIQGSPDMTQRRWVKPVEALCGPGRAAEAIEQLEQIVQSLGERVTSLETAASRQSKTAAARKTPGT